MASGRRLLRISPTVWHVALCLTVLAFVARAFVPLGFMPDSAKLKQGSLALTFCSVNGVIKTVSVDVFAPATENAFSDVTAQLLADTPADNTSHDLSGAADCPYSVSTPQVLFATFFTPSDVASAYYTVPPVVLSNVAVAPIAMGSPLGPRAPPFFTV